MEPWLDLEIKNSAAGRPHQKDRSEAWQAAGGAAEIGAAMAHLLTPRFTGQHLRIQLHDEDPGVGCLRMDAPVGAKLDSSPLIPDPYCLGTNGYEEFRNKLCVNPLPSWRDRLTMVFWRGSTTGSKNITTQNLENNLRYQLCRYSLIEPELSMRALIRWFNAQIMSRAVHEELRRAAMSKTVDPWHASPMHG